MTNIEYQKAKDSDQLKIAEVIAEAFAKDFATLCNDKRAVSLALESGINCNNFFKATARDEIVAVAALSTCETRAVRVIPKKFRKHFGLFKGCFASMVLKNEFMSTLNYPIETGYIEFVGVKDDYKRKGIVSNLLQYIIDISDFSECILDVTDVNMPAIGCYEKNRFYRNCKRKSFISKAKRI